MSKTVPTESSSLLSVDPSIVDREYAKLLEEERGTEKRTALSGIGRTVGIIALVIVFIVALVTVLHGKAFEESFRVNRPLRSPPPPPHSPHSSRGHRYSLSAPASACTDFYDDVCSALLAKTPLPADRSEWYIAFDGTKARIERTLRSLLEEDAGPAGILYQSCMDTKAIEAKGTRALRPFRQYLVPLGGAGGANISADFMWEMIGRLWRMKGRAFFDWRVSPDIIRIQKNMLYVQQGGLTLPDTAYYLQQAHAHDLTAFEATVRDGFVLSGLEPDKLSAMAAAANVVAVEKLLASLHMTSAQEFHERAPPPVTIKQLQTSLNGVNWKVLFTHMGLKADVYTRLTHDHVLQHTPFVHILDVKFFLGLNDALLAKPPLFFYDYLRWRFMDALFPHMGRRFEQLQLKLIHKLFGVNADPPRWRACVATLQKDVPLLASHLYTQHVIDPDAHRIAATMLKSLRAMFAAELQRCSWMDAATRRAALLKLQRMKFELGGPTTWPKPPFKPHASQWATNSVDMLSWSVEQQLAQLIGTVNPHDWVDVMPIAVNAYYSAHTNTLFVPAGLLQPPFLRVQHGALASLQQPTADDWGALGVLLGHEMSHAFDTTGRLFDASLQFKPWWSKHATTEYKKRSRCIERIYSAATDHGQHVNGVKTVGEDMADISGIRLSYNAWQNQTGGDIEVGQGRRFFESFGRMWCQQTSAQMATVDTATNPHAPPRVRVNVALNQSQAFRELYSCGGVSDCKLW